MQAYEWSGGKLHTFTKTRSRGSDQIQAPKFCSIAKASGTYRSEGQMDPRTHMDTVERNISDPAGIKPRDTSLQTRSNE
jgi:hypothetical protein